MAAYPPLGTQIEGNALNAAAQVVVVGNATFTYDNLQTWYVT